MGICWPYVNDQELQYFKIYYLSVDKPDTNLPCTASSAKFVCSSSEVDTHRKIN